MHSKLNLKIFGVTDSSELKLMSDNLKSQSGVASTKFFPSGQYVGVKVEFNDGLISKQQIFEIIKIGGDNLRVEELGVNTYSQTENMSGQTKTSETVAQISNSQIDKSKMYFFGGLLIGFSTVSLIINLIFGYLLFVK